MAIREVEDDGRFQLNDIELHIPPDQIQVDRQAINNYWETLRTRSSIKTRSGFAYLEIQLHIIFTDTLRPGQDNGITQLCDLVAQFRVTPFCWVENKHLRDVILGGREGQAMAMALTNMEISKVADPNNVNAVDVYMKFHWFNYLPYMREFLFREDIFSPKPVANPKQSKAWKLLYRAEQERGKYRTEITSLGQMDLQMGVRQFALVPKEQYVQAQIELEVLNRLRTINETTTQSMLESTKDTALKEQIPAEYLAAAKDVMDEAAAVAFLQALFGHVTSLYEEATSPTGFDVQDLAYVTQQNIKWREGFVDKYQWADPRFGWSPVELTPLLSDPKKRTTLEYSNELGDSLTDMANKWDQKKAGGSVMMQRLEVVNPASMGVITTGISISFENSLAMMPVIGHPYPTFQHTGAIDAVVTVSMVTAHRSGVQYMTDLYTLYEDQARKNKEVPAGQKNIFIQNDLINLCGLNEFILETMHVETIPGQPGTSNIVMKLVDNPITSSTTENLLPASSFQTDYDIRKSILDVLSRKATRIPSDRVGGLTVSEGMIAESVGGGRAEVIRNLKLSTYYDNGVKKTVDTDQLRQYVDQYITILSHTLGYLIEALNTMVAERKGKNYREILPALFLLKDTDVIGVERIQQDLTPLLAKTDDYGLLYNNNTAVPQPEEGVRQNNALAVVGALAAAPVAAALWPATIAGGVIWNDEVSDVAENVYGVGWTKEDITTDRSILAAWQTLQQNDQGGTSGPGSDLWKAAMSGLAQQKADHRLVLESFIQNYLRQYHKGMVDLLDIIAQSSVMNMDEFANVKKMREGRARVAGSETTAYPDFPLKQIMDKISDNKSLATGLISELKSADFLETYGLKNMSLGAFINPDFYVYNAYETGAADPISSAVMKQASEAIIAGQTGSAEWSRQAQEKDYLTGAYVDIIGSGKNSKILSTRTDNANEFFPDAEKKQQARVEAVNQMLTSDNPSVKAQGELLKKLEADYNSKAGELAYLNMDTLQGKQWSSIKEIHNEFILSPILPDTGGLMVTNVRKEGKLMPSDAAYTVCHNFSPAESLQIQNEGYWTPPSEPTEPIILDPGKKPTWQVPVSGPWTFTSKFGDIRKGVSGPPHKGLDIVSSQGEEATWAMDILAAADGIITSVTEDFEVKDYTYGEKHPKTVTNEKLKNKLVETTVEVKISHDGNYQSVYGHLQWDAYLQFMSSALNDPHAPPEARFVRAGQKIGKMGSTGWSTGAHLHFEIIENGTNVDPLPYIQGRSYVSKGPLLWINPDSESLLTKSVEQLEKEVTSQGYSMMRAYPTFRLYFIESDLDERKRFEFDDFFSYSAVQEITLIRSRKIAADLLIVRLTNVSGVLTNRKFKESPLPDVARTADGRIAQESDFDASRTNTGNENPIASLMLQPGVAVSLRLGYDNNPEELEKVFNGVITDVEISGAEDIVEITCQSYGIELVQNVIGEVKKFGAWYHPSGGATPNLLEELMASPEVVHFGRWGRRDKEPPLDIAYGLLQKRWKIQPQPQDDNIFAPCKHGILAFFDNVPKYTMLNTTIWDVFQEMTLRHPGYVAAVVPYEEKGMARTTMFFGVPDQLYFARDPSLREQQNLTMIKTKLKQAADAWKALEGPLQRIMDSSKRAQDMTAEDIEAVNKPLDDKSVEDFQKLLLRNTLLNYTKDRGVVKPFRSYHVLTSTNHILQNTITSSAWDTFNVVTLQYEDDSPPDVNEDTNELQFSDVESFTMELDAGMADEEKREMFAQYHNCIGQDMAKCYGIGLLAQSLKEGYSGSVTIIGNPKIKPYDICYIFDEYTNMFGPIEVEQVVQRFSKREGFITEITPDMCIHVNQSSTLATQDALGLMAEYKLRQMGVQSMPSIMSAFFDKGSMANVDQGDSGYGILPRTLAFGTSLGAKAIGATGTGAAFFFAPGAVMVGGVGGVLGHLGGAFILRKFITRTQTANAVRYSPLVLHGKPMIGGFPARKMPNGFIQRMKDKIAKWGKEAGNGIPLYADHLADKLNPNNWIHTMGTFKW